MKRISKVFFLFFLLICPAVASAQYQLPDPGFEDWSGAQFASSIQPKDWRYSNVSQLGVDKNFAHRATGRSGYCLLIQNQFVGVGSIGATSPGYVALGQPWAYVSSLTSINDATAGTYGGISWTHRPDSISLWIKRVYDSSVDQPAGDHTADENFNIVYYSWTGTAQGGSYKAKNGSCTDISRSKPAYCVDEESDIRLALDGNECGTATPGTQIAEAWYREKARYNEWTRITIPIYYLSDNAPQKCNLILSAGNYPNFRANNGIYAGNSLYVDDVNLIYSSKIQKLYINNREWKGFDPDNTTTEQTYSLGQGVTSIPEIYAVRGAGSLTNLKGTTASFSGRRLTAQECVITEGAVDGAVTTITVTSEDGSSSSTYRIRFVSQASNNARLADIRVNGQTVSGFNAYLNTYNVALPYGTTAVPQVEADPQDAGATVQITQPSSVNGTSTILVTAQDGSTTQTYTLRFSVAQLSDVTLQDILIDGASVPGFSPAKGNYTVSLPLGTTEAPQVVPVSAYPQGEQTITIIRNNLTEGCQIQVSAPGSAVSKTYKITYRIEASQYSFLQALMVDGRLIDNFNPEEFVYYLNLPLGTTALPAITWTAGDRYQSVTLDQSGLQNLEGTITLTVTAASGAQSVYRIVVAVEKSEINSLEMIYLDGQPLEGFSPNTLSYQVDLPIGTSAAPAITWLEGDEYQTVSLTAGGLSGTSRLFVTAQNGSTRIYQITFAVATSSDASLSMIWLDGQPLDGFSPEQTDYSVSLPQGTASLPAVTYLAHDPYQTISTRPAASLNGEYKIIVKPQTGAARTYTIRFSVATSANASLASISLGGQPLEGFSPDVLDYTVTLPQGVTSVPAITYEKAEPVQRVLLQTSGYTASLTVTAESGLKLTYTIRFEVLKSENAFLRLIRLDADTLPGFDPERLTYTVVLPDSVLRSPVISVEKNAGQRVLIAQPARLGTASIEVTPEQGASNIYRILFVSEADTSSVDPVDPDPEPRPLSSDGQLLSILLDGQPLSGFLPGVYAYEHLVRPSGAQLPAVSYTKGEQHQVVMMGQTAPDVLSLVVMAEAGNQLTYTLSFDYQPDTDATLHSLLLDGQPFDGFSADRSDYQLTLPADAEALPELTFSMAGKATALVSESPLEQTVDVWAEDGLTHRCYSIRYTRLPFTDASLRSLTLDGQPLDGFSPEQTSYSVQLPWHVAELPEIAAEPSSPVSSITVDYAAVGQPTTVRVVAQDGISELTYSILFTSPLSSDASLVDVQIDGAELAFDPSQHDYSVLLPYGTTAVPEILVEKALPEQQVVITRRSLQEPATVEVTAEDGSKAVYTFRFNVPASTNANVLTGIALEGVGALDMSEGPDFRVSLPFGTRSMDVVSITKSFPEQQVLIEQGGAFRPTVIRVFSGREGEPETRYTITPSLADHDPAYLTSILVDGQPLEGFDPAVYDYVVVAGENTPVVTCTASAGSAVYDNLSNLKQVSFDVENGPYMHTYTVSFFYPQDFTFDPDFETWIDHTNADANKSGSYPRGWYTALNAITSGDKGTYDPETYCVVSNTATTGAHSANLCGKYVYTSADAMPGFLSLSEPTIAVGAYLVLTHTSTSLAFGDPIRFRNTPDRVLLDYNYQSSKHINGWHFYYTANGTRQVEFAEPFSSLPAGQWRTMDQPIAYDDDFVPASLDILISSAESDNPADFYIGVSGATSGNRQASSVLVDNLRFVYSSALASVRVNGQEAQISGTDIAASVPSESWGIPSLSFTGEVSDQGRQITWQPEQNGIRCATVRSIAEDGSFTDYQLRITRPASQIDTCSWSLSGHDLTVFPGSPYQTLAVSRADSSFTIVCTSEAGSSRTYTVRFLEPSPVLHDTLPAVPFVSPVGPSEADLTPAVELSSEALLTAILVDGAPLPDFAPLVMDYAVAPRPGLVVEPVAAPGASLSVSRTDEAVSIRVTSEDLSEENTYTLAFRDLPSSDARLLGILADGLLLPGFSPDVHTYTVVLPSSEPKMEQPRMPDLAFLAADSLQQVLIELAPLGSTTYLTVTAADGNTQQLYEVLFSATPSSCSLLGGLSVAGRPVDGFRPEQFAYDVQLSSLSEAVVSWQQADAFQSVTESRTGFHDGVETITLSVIAEDGSSSLYTLTLHAPAPSSDASLLGITLNDELLDGFAPDTYGYTVTLPKGTDRPDVRIILSDDNASASMRTSGDTVVISVVAEDGVTREDYTLLFLVERSSEARLQMIILSDEELPAFSPDVYLYRVDIPVGGSKPEVDWLKMEPEQEVVLTEQGLTSVLSVTAEDGSQAQYRIEFTQLLSDVDTLRMIYEDGLDLPGFSGSQFAYSFDLPVGTSAFPELSAEPGDPWQTVLVDTLLSDPWHLTLRFSATSQQGSVNRYTVAYTILKSEVDTLQMIWLAGQPLEGFSGLRTDYDIVLPYGTTSLPEVDFVKGDAYQTADTLWSGSRLAIRVVAQSGSERTYTLRFSVARSSNALLEAISLDGTLVSGFYSRLFQYTVQLPYGTTVLPAVSWTEGDEQQQVDTVRAGNTLLLNVTAGDGVTTASYEVRFEILPSTDAQLRMIYIDGEPVAAFERDNYQYTDTLPYGTTVLPRITWLEGDEQQTVVLTAQDREITLSVTAGDGVSSEEYTVSFIILLSPNNYLRDLRADGLTVSGFCRDSAFYHIVYPVGTLESELLTAARIEALPEDPDATVSLSDEPDHSITIMVTAPNGDVRVYVITQEILLSDEARLRMIWLDGEELKGFSPDVFEYTLVLAPGTNMPEVLAEALSERADVEYGSFEDILGEDFEGKYIEIDGVAESGTRLTYRVTFRYANWSATAEADPDDYVFIHVPGTRTYKAVSISIGLSVAVYDMNGHLLMYSDVPVVDPADVTVEIDADGNQRIVSVLPEANGADFEVPQMRTPYFYVFFDTKQKRVAKGGKFALTD